MPFISEADARTLGSSTARLGFFLLIKTSTDWVRVWSGNGDFEMQANLIDTTGGIYLGAGTLAGIPDVSQLVNGVAQRIEFGLSGVLADILALADAEAESVRDAPTHIAIIGLDEGFQPNTSVIWMWEGTADVPRVDRQSQTGDDGEASIQRTISLSAVSIFSGRKRPPIAFNTGVEQRRRRADDAFMDRAAIYNQGKTRKWP